MAHRLRDVQRAYSRVVTDPERWRAYQPRDGDVVVATPPKAGTTWTQAIVAMLIAGRTDIDLKNGTDSPWLEHSKRPIGDVLAGLAAMDGRRCIKTHTPLDGMPVWSGLSYIAVCRHPVDVHFSMQRFIRKTESSLNAAFPADDGEGFRLFLDGAVQGLGFDAPSLAVIVAHAQAARREAQARVLVLHYADMRRDHRAAVAPIAAHIGVPSDAALLDAVTQATALDSMKRNADRFTPHAGTGFLKGNADFFHSGSAGKWHSRLQEADLRTYRARLDALAGPALSRWLEEGDGAN